VGARGGAGATGGGGGVGSLVVEEDVGAAAVADPDGDWAAEGRELHIPAARSDWQVMQRQTLSPATGSGHHLKTPPLSFARGTRNQALQCEELTLGAELLHGSLELSVVLCAVRSSAVLAVIIVVAIPTGARIRCNCRTRCSRCHCCTRTSRTASCLGRLGRPARSRPCHHSLLPVGCLQYVNLKGGSESLRKGNKDKKGNSRKSNIRRESYIKGLI